MVENRGFEPLTPALPAQCSPAELIPRDDLLALSTSVIILARHGKNQGLFLYIYCLALGKHTLSFFARRSIKLKKWFLGTMAAACVLASTPNVWAENTLWRSHNAPAGAPAASTPVVDTEGVGKPVAAFQARTEAQLHMRDVNFDAASTPADGPAEHSPDIRSSVQLSRNVLREAYLASRQAYTSKLQKYAKCTPAQAQKAVLEAHPGMKVEDVQLRNMRTNLVYMAIAEDDQDKFFVVIDAGNGRVLMDRPLPTRHERVFSDH